MAGKSTSPLTKQRRGGGRREDLKQLTKIELTAKSGKVTQSKSMWNPQGCTYQNTADCQGNILGSLCCLLVKLHLSVTAWYHYKDFFVFWFKILLFFIFLTGLFDGRPADYLFMILFNGIILIVSFYWQWKIFYSSNFVI